MYEDISQDELSHFMSGSCSIFAVALHDLTGLPLVGIAQNFLENNGSIAIEIPHVAVLVDTDGSIFDIRGES